MACMAAAHLGRTRWQNRDAAAAGWRVPREPVRICAGHGTPGCLAQTSSSRTRGAGSWRAAAQQTGRASSCRDGGALLWQVLRTGRHLWRRDSQRAARQHCSLAARLAGWRVPGPPRHRAPQAWARTTSMLNKAVCHNLGSGMRRPRPWIGRRNSEGGSHWAGIHLFGRTGQTPAPREGGPKQRADCGTAGRTIPGLPTPLQAGTCKGIPGRASKIHRLKRKINGQNKLIAISGGTKNHQKNIAGPGTCRHQHAASAGGLRAAG